jgi:hypothetical protein
MNIRYRVELNAAERCELTALLSAGHHPARKLKRAQILLAGDAGIADEDVAETVGVGLEFFSDGITEEITAALAKILGLRVVARISAFQFKAQNRDIQSIGQQLHGTHFIEGSVRIY